MSLSDPIGDMLTRIKNAYKALLLSVEIPYSSHKVKILDIFKDKGYVVGYKVTEIRKGIKTIEVDLRYSRSGRAAIDILQRVSKPSRRVYASYKDLKPFLNGMGTWILSTVSGVISDTEARRSKVGGEIICKVF